VKQVIALFIALSLTTVALTTVALPAMAAAGDPNSASVVAGLDWTDLVSFLLAAMGIAGLLIIRRQVSHL